MGKKSTVHTDSDLIQESVYVCIVFLSETQCYLQCFRMQSLLDKKAKTTMATDYMLCKYCLQFWASTLYE